MDRYLMLKNANVPQMAQLLCNMITDMPFDDLPEACNSFVFFIFDTSFGSFDNVVFFHNCSFLFTLGLLDRRSTYLHFRIR